MVIEYFGGVSLETNMFHQIWSKKQYVSYKVTPKINKNLGNLEDVGCDVTQNIRRRLFSHQISLHSVVLGLEVLDPQWGKASRSTKSDPRSAAAKCLFRAKNREKKGT